MPHDIRVSQPVLDRIARLRGQDGLRLYPDVRPERTAFVVVDMQNVFVAEGALIEVPMARTIIPNINRAATVCRDLGVPVIWIRLHHPADVSDWWGYFNHFVSAANRQADVAALTGDAEPSRFFPDMDVRDEDFVVVKNRYSCFIAGSSSLERLLRSMGRDTVLLAGTATNICVESTARDGMMLDFQIVLLGDATAAHTDAEHQASIDVLAEHFADVLTTDEALDELKLGASASSA